MTYQDYDPKLEESTNRWMAVGVVFLFLFVAAFPVYWFLQPDNLAEARHRTTLSWRAKVKRYSTPIVRSVTAARQRGPSGQR